MSGDARWDFKWRDKEVIQLSQEQLSAIMSEFTLVAEGESKKELTKGHGVLTGTLRRSIHGASGKDDFAGENVEPSAASPERGNQKVTPVRDGNKLLTSLGSGLVYAMRMHQGWGTFAGYHFITNGVDKAKGKMNEIIARHQVK
jgi:hypothetical protein